MGRIRGRDGSTSKHEAMPPWKWLGAPVCDSPYWIQSPTGSQIEITDAERQRMVAAMDFYERTTGTPPSDLAQVAIDHLTDVLSGAMEGDPYALMQAYLERFAEEKSHPARIIFFDNGLAAVFDQRGQQMPKYQEGNHQQVVGRLEADGYHWQALDVTGSPQMLDRRLRETHDALMAEVFRRAEQVAADGWRD